MAESSESSRDRGLMKVVAAVGAVATAIGAIVALATQVLPGSAGPSAGVGGHISEVTVDRSSLADYQQQYSPHLPRRCPGFKQPAAVAERGPGSAGGTGLAERAVIIPIRGAVSAGGPMAWLQNLAQAAPLGSEGAGNNTTPGTETSGQTSPTTTGGATSTPGTTTPTSTTTTTTTTTPAARLASPLVQQQRALPSDIATGKPNPTPQVVATTLAQTQSSNPNLLQRAIAQIRADPSMSPAQAQALVRDAAPFMLGNDIGFHVEVKGMSGRCAYVRSYIFDRRTGQPLRDSAIAQRDALYFVATAPTAQLNPVVWVPRPDQPGNFFVRLELFDDQRQRLDHNDQAVFRVP